MNTTLGDTYKLAFVKEAGWIGTGAKTVGKFLAATPFFIAGMAGTQALFGKKPKVTRKYVSQEQYDQLSGAQSQRRPAGQHISQNQRMMGQTIPNRREGSYKSMNVSWRPGMSDQALASSVVQTRRRMQGQMPARNRNVGRVHVRPGMSQDDVVNAMVSEITRMTGIKPRY